MAHFTRSRSAVLDIFAQWAGWAVPSPATGPNLAPRASKAGPSWPNRGELGGGTNAWGKEAWPGTVGEGRSVAPWHNNSEYVTWASHRCPTNCRIKDNPQAASRGCLSPKISRWLIWLAQNNLEIHLITSERILPEPQSQQQRPWFLFFKLALQCPYCINHVKLLPSGLTENWKR